MTTMIRGAPELWRLRLYVAGQTPKSLKAFSNLKTICETNLSDRYSIEVIDLMQRPQLSKDDQGLAIPTLVRPAAGARAEDHRRSVRHAARPRRGSI
jgi:hypothetical protein